MTGLFRFSIVLSFSLFSIHCTNSYVGSMHEERHRTTIKTKLNWNENTLSPSVRIVLGHILFFVFFSKRCSWVWVSSLNVPLLLLVFLLRSILTYWIYSTEEAQDRVNISGFCWIAVYVYASSDCTNYRIRLHWNPHWMIYIRRSFSNVSCFLSIPIPYFCGVRSDFI